jgi:hypothetical protein
MRQEHKDFLELNIHNHETIKAGYAKNLDNNLLIQYESIYKEYINKDFVLTKWCGTCVYDCLKRVYDYYFSLPHTDTPTTPQANVNNFVFPDDLDIIVPDPNAEPVQLQKRKGRPKRN